MSQDPKPSPVAVQEPGTTARNDQDEVLKAMLRGEPFELESFKNPNKENRYADCYREMYDALHLSYTECLQTLRGINRRQLDEYQIVESAFEETKLQELKVNINISNTLIRALIQHFESVFRVPLTEDIRTSFRLLHWDLQGFSEAETTSGTYVFRPLKPTYGNDGSPLLEPLHRNVAAQAKADEDKSEASGSKEEAKENRALGDYATEEDTE